MDKVLIAMSGGVDSSVAAFLMKEQGCECIGATMKLFHNEDIGVSRTKTCCSLEDVEDARLVALRLGIPYYVFNFSDDFKGQVIDRFISSYERGATPNPCIDCNRYLKFERLYERTRILGCDAIVTGHYARIEQENGRWLLKKSLDESKDQSYVLYSLTQDQLAHTRLPLGAMHKSETRRIAEEQGFYNADKPDSHGARGRARAPRLRRAAARHHAGAGRRALRRRHGARRRHDRLKNRSSIPSRFPLSGRGAQEIPAPRIFYAHPRSPSASSSFCSARFSMRET